MRSRLGFRRYTVTLIVILALSVLPSSITFASDLVFGPVTCQRGTGAPTAFSYSFTAPEPSRGYIFKVYNGGLEDTIYEQVSSSTITLNGSAILGPSNFNQNVAYLEVPVTLQSQNTLNVEVRGKPGGAIFGDSPCLASAWGLEYFRKLRQLYEATGMTVLEHDGSYPGDVCASTGHPGHEGLQDSQWRQWELIRDYYQWSAARGIYLNVPDWYFLNGSNKTAMGYRETNWSLPRDRQFLLARQNIYDGTWDKSPSMGWMFVPLTQYHGGGAEATLEPLKDHLEGYAQHLTQNFTSGVQAAYRGPRLFDAPETKAVVKRWVDLYKAHRAILDSDVIHLRRADARDWDGLLHVNPELKEKGFATLFNPLDEPIRRSITLPLYYTGLTTQAIVRVNGGTPRRYALDRQFNVQVDVTIPARGSVWLVIE